MRMRGIAAALLLCLAACGTDDACQGAACPTGNGGAACDPAACAAGGVLYFYDAAVVGAVPVYRDGDSWARVCGASDLPAGQSLAGLAIDLQLVSTERKEQNEAVFDTDRSVQVGDCIDRHCVAAADLGPATVSIEADCVKSVAPGLDYDCDVSSDLGVGSPGLGASVVQVSHVAFADRVATWVGGEGPGIGVVVLVDQSGSVNGFVQPNPDVAPPDGKPDRHFEMTYDDANYALTRWQQESGDVSVQEHLASDKRHLRLLALQDFVAGLNVNDRLLVVGYNEDERGRLVCSGPEIPSPTPAECFSTRRDWVARGLNDLPGNEGGRTPLWDALYEAVTFLQGQPGLAGRHVVVLGDGPDTCSPTSEHFVGGVPCGQRSFDDVRAAARASSSEAPVHLHFVQYQAVGYVERDPAQMELACLTDGTYTFVNQRDMGAGATEFSDALLAAMDRARRAFLGTWRVFVALDAVGIDAPWPSGMPGGHLFALRGALTLRAGPFVLDDRVVAFRVGSQTDAAAILDTPNWDNTLVFRKGCQLDSQCGGDDTAGCVARCGWESGLCKSVDLPLAGGAACMMENGAGGVCCFGDCLDPDLACE